MKLPAPRARRESENILPLANVVFLLLIFFMVAGALTRAELFEVDPPTSNSADSANVRETVILLGDDGRLALEGKAMSESELQDAIAARLEKNSQASVKLKADAQTDGGRLIELMELLRETGVTQITLLTLPKDAR